MVRVSTLPHSVCTCSLASSTAPMRSSFSAATASAWRRARSASVIAASSLSSRIRNFLKFAASSTPLLSRLDSSFASRTSRFILSTSCALPSSRSRSQLFSYLTRPSADFISSTAARASLSCSSNSSIVRWSWWAFTFCSIISISASRRWIFADPPPSGRATCCFTTDHSSCPVLLPPSRADKSLPSACALFCACSNSRFISLYFSEKCSHLALHTSLSFVTIPSALLSSIFMASASRARTTANISPWSPNRVPTWRRMVSMRAALSEDCVQI
mmetsp:Transcript_37002/g.116405  ORF Transcript_37002/g.116405 Transcript_37002/m.116405 type:complete len:273 (-) Transcript_37002:631-1449(-)